MSAPLATHSPRKQLKSMGNSLRQKAGREQLSHQQMIIQCPSCDTKFALDEASIEDIEDPRFHCSRCDHVFSFEESAQRIPLTTTPAAKIESTPPPSRSITPVATISSHSLGGDSSTRSLTIPEDLSPSDALEAPHESSPYEPESFSSGSHKSPQIPLQLSPDTLEGSVVDTLELDPTSSTLELDPLALEKGVKRFGEPATPPTIQPKSPPSIAARTTEPTLQVSKRSLEIPRPVSAQPQITPTPASSTGYSPRLSTPLRQDPQSSPVIPSPSAVTYTSPSAIYQTSNSKGPWKGFILLASPVVAFLTFLVASGMYLRFDTSAASSLSDILFPSIPKLPPPELYLKSTKLKTVTLEGGERVFVVSGKLANDSQETFEDVLVEAVLFEANGSPLIRTKARASSSLAKGKIKSLTPEVIEEAQSAGTPTGYSVPSGSHTEFVVVINNGQPFPEMKSAKYFSARIYSVDE